MPDDKSPIAEASGNGHSEEGEEEIRQGATFELEDLASPNSLFSRAIAGRNNSGVLRQLISAVEEDKSYRQELKLGRYSSPRKAAQAPLAIKELHDCGVDYTVIVDIICAQQAGINQEYVKSVLEALTHTTFTTNYQQEQMKRRSNAKNNSPLA